MKLVAALTIAFAIPLFLVAQQHPQLPEGWEYIGSGYMRGPSGELRVAPPRLSPATPWDPLVFAAPMPLPGDPRNPIHVAVQQPRPRQSQERKYSPAELLLLLEALRLQPPVQPSQPSGREPVPEISRQPRARPQVIYGPWSEWKEPAK